MSIRARRRLITTIIVFFAIFFIAFNVSSFFGGERFADWTEKLFNSAGTTKNKIAGSFVEFRDENLSENISSRYGLVAHYSFIDNFDDGVGGNTANRKGNVSFILKGAGGKALYFDGHSGYLRIPATFVNSPSQEVTASGWFKTRGLRGEKGTEITGSWLSKRDSYMLFPFTDGSVAFQVSINGLWHDARSAPHMIVPGQWEKWTGTYNGTVIALYKNNQLVATKLIEGSLGRTGDICVGHDCAGVGNNRYFFGALDEIEIYNRALTAEEVNTLYWKEKPQQGENGDVGTEVIKREIEVEEEPVGSYSFEDENSSQALTMMGATIIPDGNGGTVLDITHEKYALMRDIPQSLGQLTVFAWIYPNSTEPEWQAIAEKGSESERGWHFYMHNDSLYFAPESADPPIQSKAGVLTAKKWQLVSATWNGGEVALYIDGEKVGNGQVTTINNKPQKLLIGTRLYGIGPTLGFSGYMDEFLIYSRALSQQEILQKYGKDKEKYSNLSVPNISIQQEENQTIAEVGEEDEYESWDALSQWYSENLSAERRIQICRDNEEMFQADEEAMILCENSSYYEDYYVTYCVDLYDQQTYEIHSICEENKEQYGW